MLHRIVVVLVMFVSLGAIPAAASAEACPDEGLREQINSSRLPDCRAYELVTPGADKQGNALALQQSFISNDGNRISFKLYNALQDATVSFGGYVATRGAGGWESHSIGNLPAPDPTSKAGNFNANVNGASSDVSQAFVVTNGGSAANNPVYGAWSVSPDGSASLLAANPPGGSVEQVGSSPDGSHVVLAAYTEPLAPVPGGPLEPGADVLYEHVGGGLRLINVDDSGNLLNPSGARFPSDSKYGGNSGAFNAISSDGSRIFFYSQQPGETPSQPKDQLYMRVNGSHTIEVSAPQPSAPPGSHVHATFAGASADGTKAFFTSSGQLTADATGTGPFLYEFNLPVGAGSGSLRLIAGVDHPVSQVLISDDASHVYYLSADGGGSLFAYHTTGPQAGQTHMVSQGLGDVSLGGDTRLIAELGSNPELIPGEVTPDGNHLLFTSNKQLTAGDTNTGAQLYKFDDSASGGSLTLISTGPAAPTSMFNSELLAANFEAVGQFGDGHYPPDGLLVQDYPIALANQAAVGFGNQYHNISDDGRYVFFETGVPLVPGDVNGKVDVYRWHEGTVALISAGTGEYDSYFVGASADGSTAIFATRDDLVSQDGDNQIDYYAARIGGGFPPLARPLDCQPGDCQGQPSAAPTFGAPGSATFSGTGNLSATPSTTTVKAKSKVTASQLRARKLARALHACRSKSKPRSKRKRCEASARKRYGSNSRAKSHKGGK